MADQTCYIGLSADDKDIEHKNDCHHCAVKRRWRWCTVQTCVEVFRKVVRYAKNLTSLCAHLFPVLASGGLIMAIILLTTHTHPVLPFDSNCGSDGRFSLSFDTYGFDYENYTIWSISDAFDINLGYGSFEFRYAKLIDIAWDLVIGRGGQAFLIWMSYNVFALALTRLMQEESVTLHTFEAITIQDGSIVSIWRMAKGVTKNAKLRVKITIAWMFFSALCVLVFPTLSSAATGYAADFDPYVQINNSRIPVSELQPVYYIIHDAHRLGDAFDDDFPVVDLRPRPSKLVIPNFSYITNGMEEDNYGRSQYMSICGGYAPGNIYSSMHNITIEWKAITNHDEDVICNRLWHVSEYVYRFGLGGTNETASLFNDNGRLVNLTSPSLNISATYDTRGHFSACTGIEPDCIFAQDPAAWAIFPSGFLTISRYGCNDSTSYLDACLESDTSNQTYKYYSFTDNRIQMFALGNRTYSAVDILAQGICQQQSSINANEVQYKWGFSSTLTLTLLILLLLWAIGTYAVHMDNYMNTRAPFRRRRIGLRRAVIDLAASYRERSGDADTSMYSEDQLELLIGDEVISYQNLARRVGGTNRKEQMQRSFRIWWNRLNTAQRWLVCILSFVVIGILVAIIVRCFGYGYGADDDVDY